MVFLSQLVFPALALPFTANRRRQIAVHELDRVNVADANGSIRPFGAPAGFQSDPLFPTQRPSLTFTLWNLFHAMAKAEMLRPGPSENIWLRALGNTASRFTDFSDSQELRLRDGRATAYADFRASHHAGALAEGMAILFMQSQGYAYTERMKSLIRRGVNPAVPGGPALNNLNGLPARDGDFIFERGDAQGGIALAESKGSFVAPNGAPNIKGDLRNGLAQLQNWPALIDPAPLKSFVIGTYFREENDAHPEPPMVAFVDPPGEGSENEENSIRLGNDTIRRANFGAALRELGFDEAANAIHRPESARYERTSHEMLVVTIPSIGGDRKFAVRILGILDGLSIEPDEWLLNWPRLRSRKYLSYPELVPPFPWAVVVISAMEIETLRQVSAAVGEPGSRILLEHRPMTDAYLSEENDAVRGSFFPDGTFIGAVTLDWLSEHREESQEFAL